MGVWLIVAMTVVLASWLALLAMLVGLGLGLQTLIGVRSTKTNTLLLSPWNGLAILILFLQVWHFILPVRWPALIVAGFFSLTGLWAARSELAVFIRSIRISPPLVLVTMAASLWIANRAIGPGDAFDSGLYHYSIVRWNHEHPIVPGLANLLPHYAFNNSCHLFVAMLQVGWWDGRANHLANGLLVWIWLGTVAISAARLIRGSGSRAQNLFNLVLAVPLVMYGVSKEASSPTSDLPQALMAFVAASGLVALLARDRNDDADDSALLTISVVLLSSAGLCIKLSAGPLCVTMGVVALAVYLVKYRSPQWTRAVVVWSCSLSLALALTWVGRSLVLSGYPLFPSKALPVPVEWRFPANVAAWFDTDVGNMGRVRVQMLQRATSSEAFARLPGWIARPIVAASRDEASAIGWVMGVLIASTVEIALPVFIAIAALVLLLFRRFTKQSGDSVGAVEWLAYIPPVVALACWTVISPEPRFGAAAFWILAAVLVSMAARAMRHPARIVIAFAVLSLVPIGYRAMVLKFNPASGPVLHALFIPAGPDHGFHPIPVAKLRRQHTKSGLSVFMPVDSPLCWDAPLPATPMLNYSIRLRAFGDLEAGFVAE